jgi:hypothetical protein
MMMRLAIGLLAAGIVSLSAASAWAFGQTILSPGGSGSGSNPTLTDPDNKPASPDNSKSGPGVRPFGSEGPTLQFGVHHGSSSTSGSESGRNGTPDYYRSLLNGN